LNTLNYDYFFKADHEPALLDWLNSITAQIKNQSDPARHGHFPAWLETLFALPHAATDQIELNSDVVTTHSSITDTAEQKTRQAEIKEHLLKLTPWRKGPFSIEGVFVDSEWQSFLKWNRIANFISPLNNRSVLDVGCGNGYYGYRMLGAGAKSVVGVDPGELFCTQFLAINHFIKSCQLAVLPLTGEVVFDSPYHFDTVFSMGVLSHRRQPQEHLQGLHSCLKSGGELVLETLVIESESAEEMIPEDRYANMRNVWRLPSVPLLIEQVQQAGFSDVRCVDVCRTTTTEQRTTQWMPSYSLQNGLNTQDQSLTKEGYPAPVRAVIIAAKL